mgnify:FL=1
MSGKIQARKQRLRPKKADASAPFLLLQGLFVNVYGVNRKCICQKQKGEDYMDIINENNEIQKEYDPVTTAGMKLGNVLLLAGGLCFFIRLLIITFTTMGMMQGFLSLLVVGTVLVVAGGAVYLVVGIKSAAGIFTAQDADRKKICKINVLKSVRIVAVIAGVMLALTTSNSGVDLMPVVYVCIGAVVGITVIIIKKEH